MRLVSPGAAVVLALVLLVTGCGLQPPDPLRQVETEIGAPVQVVAEAGYPGGKIQFYRYTVGGQCGDGWVLRPDGQRGGGGGRGSGPCASKRTLTVGGGAHSGDDSLALLYGEVGDPRIVRVLVGMRDGGSVEAEVKNGIWYLLFPGRTETVDFLFVSGLGATGEELDRFEPR